MGFALCCPWILVNFHTAFPQSAAFLAEVHSAELQIQQGLQEFGVLYKELQYFLPERV